MGPLWLTPLRPLPPALSLGAGGILLWAGPRRQAARATAAHTGPQPRAAPRSPLLAAERP